MASAPPWIVGLHDTDVRPVPRVATRPGSGDRWGAFRCRVSGLRHRYTVQPGLYAVGSPGKDSEVFVSANYKLSFDALRTALDGVDGWILVLDTRGINVWCAAGKGTFGTEELVKRIHAEDLHRIVSHRRLIVPQLGASGVSAPRVKEYSGFTVLFGPVRATDIKAYIAAGRKATPDMRKVSFPMKERLVLTPMELLPALRYFLWFALGLLLFFGFQPEGILFADAWRGAAPFLGFGLLAVFSGAFLTPALLPFAPFRSFALKGLVLGIACHAVAVYTSGAWISLSPSLLSAANIFFPLGASYIALQFTGSTTFTGPTGVRRELRLGMPFYLGGCLVSLLLLVWYKLGALGWL